LHSTHSFFAVSHAGVRPPHVASLVHFTHRPALALHAGPLGEPSQSADARHSGHAFSSSCTSLALRSPVRHASRQSASVAADQHDPFGPYVAAITPSSSGVVLPTHAMYASQIARLDPEASLVPPSPPPIPEGAHCPDCSKVASAFRHASVAPA
jgi:hypothetical protein